ncbi:MAG: hypothetical protein ACRBN8_32935 [Nannocystales bacterium]
MRWSLCWTVSVLTLGCGVENDGQGFTPGAEGGGTETASPISAAGTESGSGAETTEEDDGGTGVKLDVGSNGSGSGPGCPGSKGGSGGLSEVAFSNIWIANSPAGTVSKIDTVTGNEIGRYRTGPATTTDPSRTTVNLVGDVAVLNRGDGGSVVKIAADPKNGCVDSNNDGQIQTSTGPDDVLAWGDDECVLWTTGLWAGARAAAWDSGSDPQAEDCAGVPSLWVSAMGADMTVHVQRLDGETGTVEDETSIPSWDGSAEWGGMYGGAVDQNRNFWMIGKDNAALFRVDFETMAVDRYEGPSGVTRFYGIAMDKSGNPYVTAEFDNRLLRFDADAESFEEVVTIDGTLRGLAVDGDGDAWIATNEVCGVAHYDAESGTVTPITLPECNIPVGVSIDIDGFVWVVDQWAGAPPFGRAHKIDPNGYNIELTVDGLDTPYTYSDMTGAGLNLVSFPPAG